MSTHEHYTNQDFSNILEMKTDKKIISKKNYVSPTLTELGTTEKIEGGNFSYMNENSSGLVSGGS